MPYGYAFPTILHSATLEIGFEWAQIGALIRPRTPPDIGTQYLVLKLDSDNVPIYDSDPSTRVARQGIIFIIFFFGWIVQQDSLCSVTASSSGGAVISAHKGLNMTRRRSPTETTALARTR